VKHKPHTSRENSQTLNLTIPQLQLPQLPECQISHAQNLEHPEQKYHQSDYNHSNRQTNGRNDCKLDAHILPKKVTKTPKLFNGQIPMMKKIPFFAAEIDQSSRKLLTQK